MFQGFIGNLYKHTWSDVLNVILTCLVFVCVFDPGNKILHMKMPFFCMSWFIFFLIIITKNNKKFLDLHSLTFAYIMILIPLVSIAYYNLFYGNEPYDGFEYFKSYLFISIVCILSATKIDLIPRLSWILTSLSLVIIVIYLIAVNYPEIEYAISVYGSTYGNINLGNKWEGDTASKRVFYTTSLMIAIAISYFVYKALTTDGKRRNLYVLMSFINIVGMFLGGTRNNRIISILLPLLILYWYSKQKKIATMIIFIVMSVILFSYHDTILEMFSLDDVSNSLKISYLPDYNIIFAEPLALLFGQGLGSYYYWNVLGQHSSMTELTLLEIFRNYGLIGGFALLFMLLLPLKELFDKSKKNIHYCLLGYLCYLVMALFNPILFSSSGMLILSIVVSKVLITKSKSTPALSVA